MALKWLMTYAFTHMGIFPSSPSPPPSPPPSLPLKSQPRGPNPSLKAEIWASKLGTGPLDLNIKAVILALRLQFEPQGWNLSPEPGIQARDSDLYLRLQSQEEEDGKGGGEEGGGGI